VLDSNTTPAQPSPNVTGMDPPAVMRGVQCSIVPKLLQSKGLVADSFLSHPRGFDNLLSLSVARIDGWRRGWDSNPRAGYPTRRFRGVPVTTTSVPLRSAREQSRDTLIPRTRTFNYSPAPPARNTPGCSTAGQRPRPESPNPK